jgi:hypothetical protein
MKNVGFIKMLFLFTALTFCVSYGYGDSPHAPVRKKISTNTITNLKAVSNESNIVISYSVADGANNACIVVSDIMGNRVKVVKLNDGKGSVTLSKDVLDKAAGSGMLNCSILVNGNKVTSQSVKLIN